MSKAPKLRFPEFEGEWEEKKVIDTFKIISIRNIQIKNSEIKKKGKYKVVDQGKDLVAGFSDKNNTFKNVPVIIFGDHTTIIKYIDFEFIVGADGVKILTNKDSSNNLKYLFYNLQQNNVEQEGYKRHFTLLSERYLQIPLEQNEQQKIADCLSALDEQITAEEEALEALKAYKKGLLQQLFPEGVSKSTPPPLIFNKLPKLRFAGFEGEWEEVKLGEICNITNGKANVQDHIEGGRYPLFDRSEIVKASNEYFLDCETVILPGEGVRFTPKYYKGKFNLHQRAYALKDFSCSGLFLYYAIYAKKDLLATKAVQSTVLSLRLPILQNFEICIPVDIAEQEKIANCLSSLDELIEAKNEKIKLLKSYKKGLLQQMFVN